jgi:nitrate/nitrite transporter NarK
VASITALSFAVIGIAAATPLFFTLVTEYLSAAAAAACIALISSLGNLGPVVAPSINGWIVQHTGSTTYALYLVMVLYVLLRAPGACHRSRRESTGGRSRAA